MHTSSSLTSALCCTLLLAACSGSGNPETDPNASETVLADFTKSTLVNNIVTGADSADNETHWLCELTNDTEKRENYVLSFWANETGIAGTQNMSWFAVDDKQLSISWGSNQVSLNNFLFEENGEGDAFSATSNKNDRLDCQLKGPKPLSGELQLDFTPLADARIVNERTNQNDAWECIATDLNGAREIRNYSFWRDGMGTSNSGNFSWYFNDDENINVSYESGVRELRSVRFADDSQQSRNFTALDRQFTLNCTRSQ